MDGHFVLSLDFEKHWGVFDKRSVKSYHENLINVKNIISRLLNLADQYEIKLTFATVGFLFAKDKEELLKFSPKNKPTYSNSKRFPYSLFDQIGENETQDPYHYALSSIKEIQKNGNHEIGTHTFSHYYCHEEGQTVKQFEEDLTAAIGIAKSKGVKIESIIFPRNMVALNNLNDKQYLDICHRHNIKSFRGKEKAFFYNIRTNTFYKNWIIFRMLRLMDTYFNITSYKTYRVQSHIKKNSPLNLPSSAILRAYQKRLSFLEPLKVLRIKKAMRHAARNKELFHLWFHPHNFGTFTDENFFNLEEIFKEYKLLQSKYNFESETMTSLTEKVVNT